MISTPAAEEGGTSRTGAPLCVSPAVSSARSRRIRTERQEIALPRILIATGERAVEAFEAADNAVDADFVLELERIVARSRDELAALTEHHAAPS